MISGGVWGWRGRGVDSTGLDAACEVTDVVWRLSPAGAVSGVGCVSGAVGLAGRVRLGEGDLGDV